MVERLSDSFSLWREYEVLLGGSQRFQEALAAVYFNILVFLKNAKHVFMTKGYKGYFFPITPSILRLMAIGFTIVCKTVWRTFEDDFEEVLEAIARHTNSLEGEIALAHRLDMRKTLDRQLQEQRNIRESLSRVEVRFSLAPLLILSLIS